MKKLNKKINYKKIMNIIITQLKKNKNKNFSKQINQKQQP